MTCRGILTWLIMALNIPLVYQGFHHISQMNTKNGWLYPQSMASSSHFLSSLPSCVALLQCFYFCAKYQMHDKHPPALCDPLQGKLIHKTWYCKLGVLKRQQTSPHSTVPCLFCWYWCYDGNVNLHSTKLPQPLAKANFWSTFYMYIKSKFMKTCTISRKNELQ